MDYVLIRGKESGLFAGYLESRNGTEVVLRSARWIWYWEGAASAAQLAVGGTSKPKTCKFTVAIDKVEMLDVVQVFYCTEKAKLSIENVPEWSA